MKPDLSRERLGGTRLMVATPMYEGMCHALYTRGLVELALRCRDLGVLLTLNMTTNQACVNRARAYIAHEFLHSDADHLMMIDADIGFAADDVLALLALQAEGGGNDRDVIGGAYSRKTVNWAAAGNAARASSDISLAAIAGSMTVNFGDEPREMRVDQPHSVESLAAGFIMIAKPVFAQLAKLHPELAFKVPAQEQAALSCGPQAVAFFENLIDENGEYLSEDHAFCRRVTDAGMDIWLCPWIDLVHIGNMQFGGSFSEMAKLAAAQQVAAS